MPGLSRGAARREGGVAPPGSMGSPGVPPLRYAALVLPFIVGGVLALGALRLAFLLRYLPEATWATEPHGVWQALAVGLRFDLKVLALVALVWLAPCWGLERCVGERWRGAILGTALAFGFALPLLAQVAQHFYYAFYKTAFTPVVFGLVEDDTAGVLKVVWQDYPVLRGFLGLALATALLFWATRAAARWLSPRLAAAGRPTRWGVKLLIVAMLLLAARGSFGVFPLRRGDAEISAQPVLNDSVRNGVAALYDAWVDRSEQVTIARADERLAHYGFDSPMAAARVLGLEANDADEVEAALYARTPVNPMLRERPPHVVVALMESWSGVLMQSSDPARRELLGRFAPHREHDLWFTHFYPVQGGTHPTLEGLLLNSPLTPLTQGRYGAQVFATSAAKPFREAGYRNVFVYGGPGNWRSVQRVFAGQGFDASYAQADIQQRYPEAGANTWGVYDEYLMRFVGDLLDEAERAGQPLFVFFLTTTHHPPHALPPGATAPPQATSGFGALRPTPELTEPLLQTLHYANDQFGGLLDRIAKAPYAGRTIVAATGDHNMKSIFDYEMPGQLRELHAVPLYLHVPATYAAGAQPDPERVGSHRDLFPTLYRLALSEARYLRSGHSMLHPVEADAAWGLTMGQTLFAAEGAASPLVGTTRYFVPGLAGLVPTETPPAVLQRKRRRAAAITALEDWLIRREVLRDAPALP
jgi:phosphoglycerol transferase MdoB-like AlkP superfamily enzyme